MPRMTQKPIRVLEMYAGLGGGSAAFRDRDHLVVTTDFNPDFGCTITGDVLADETLQQIRDHGPYDFIWASPPCEGFSVCRMGANWIQDPVTKGIQGPRSDKARMAMTIVDRTLEIIGELGPEWWIMENPRAAMRKIPQVQHLELRPVTYCQFGMPFMKPTDLWSDRWPWNLILPAPCKNGSPCHEAAPRGANAGIQGLSTSAERALVPYALSLRVCLAIEHLIAAREGRAYQGKQEQEQDQSQACLF